MSKKQEIKNNHSNNKTLFNFTFTKSSMLQWVSKNSMWVILIGLVIVMAIITKGKFIKFGNIKAIFESEAAYGILAIGVAFTIISRGIDLSVGSLVSLCSVVSASFAQTMFDGRVLGNFPTLKGPICALIGLLIGLIFGSINGWFIAYTKIHPFIATLGTMSACRGLANLYSNGQPVSRLVGSYTWLSEGQMALKIPFTNLRFSFPLNIVLVFFLFAIIAWFILNQTRFGRHIYAIGGNDVAARVAGVKVEKNIVAIYAWSGLCAGAAAVLMAGRVGSGNPTLGLTKELDAIAAATIGGVSQTGGVGTVSGIIAGVFILGIVKSALIFLGVSTNFQEIVKGIIIVTAVVIDMRKHKRR